MPLKRFENNPNNEYIVNEEGNLQSREVAEKYIYLKHGGKYPKPFWAYVVHHIDGDTFNNSVKNLYICTKEEHNLIHSEQIKNKRRFITSLQIDEFLIKKRIEENKKIEDFSKKETKLSPRIEVEYEKRPYVSQSVLNWKARKIKRIERNKISQNFREEIKQNALKEDKSYKKMREENLKDWHEKKRKNLRSYIDRIIPKLSVVLCILSSVTLSYILLTMGNPNGLFSSSTIRTIFRLNLFLMWVLFLSLYWTNNDSFKAIFRVVLIILFILVFFTFWLAGAYTKYHTYMLASAIAWIVVWVTKKL